MRAGAVCVHARGISARLAARRKSHDRAEPLAAACARAHSEATHSDAERQSEQASSCVCARVDGGRTASSSSRTNSSSSASMIKSPMTLPSSLAAGAPHGRQHTQSLLRLVARKCGKVYLMELAILGQKAFNTKASSECCGLTPCACFSRGCS